MTTPNSYVAILPFLNRENVISRCVESILEAVEKAHLSGHSFHFLLIAIDNGSTDNSRNVITRSFHDQSASNLDLRVLECSKGGAANARNVGIDFAISHCPPDSALFFVDSDDALDIDFFCNTARYWNGQSIISFVLKTEASKKTKTEDGSTFLRRLFVFNKTHQNCALWNRVFPLKMWTSIRLPDIPFCEDLGGLISLFSQPKCEIKLIYSYCGYRLYKDVPGETRCKADNSYYFNWLVSLGYLSKMHLPHKLTKTRNSFIFGFFLELWPRYQFRSGCNDQLLCQSISLLLSRKLCLDYRPRRIQDFMKKWLYFLTGSRHYYRLYRKIRGIS